MGEFDPNLQLAVRVERKRHGNNKNKITRWGTPRKKRKKK
jgi:hypothetical protein